MGECEVPTDPHRPVHSSIDHSRWILLLHHLGCPHLHHLHRRAHCSVGLSEEGHVGRRHCDFPPMAPLDGADVLGLREGRYRLEECALRPMPIGS